MKEYKNKINIVSLFIGIVGFILLLIFPVSESNILASNMAAIVFLMAVWWMTESVPIAATSLVPLVLMPILGIESGAKIASLYFNSIVFLFMGGFLIAIAMEKWDLHKRIALNLINKIGNNPKSIILGFMVSSFVLSMFISNTATAIMMLPIGLSIINKLESDFDIKDTKNFSIALMLGIAYASSIGGIATLIGTAPNLAFKSIYEATFPDGQMISFSKWLVFAFPLAVVIMILMKFLILDVLFKPSKDLKMSKEIIVNELNLLQKIKFEEKSVLIILISTAILWIFRIDIDLSIIKIPGWSNIFGNPKFIDDGTVSIGMALLLFLIPSKNFKGKRLLSKTAFNKMPWGIIILFGGGFALSYGFESTGLSVIIGNLFIGFKSVPPIVTIFLICLMMTFVTELTSNTATTYTMLPIFAAISVSMGIDPLSIMIPATLTASFSFMLPVATPPNAIVFSSNRLKIKEMAKAGLVLNLASVVIVTLYYYAIGDFIWNQ